jgi:hypothetical protein
MKCPNNFCVWREKHMGICIAPLDERLKRNCPLPQDDAKMTDSEALEYIRERYPEQRSVWNDYLKRRELLKVKVHEKDD